MGNRCSVAHFLSAAIPHSLPVFEMLPQAQTDERLTRMPLWIWILVSLVVIAIGVIWTLREEEALASALPRPATIPEPVAAKPDDLKMVKGIGPKISGELNERGIFTFEQLAATEPAYLEELMHQLKWSEINHPDTWPEQARLLAEEKRRKHST